jgi:putative transposase
MGGHRRRVLDPHRDFIIGRIGETPHLTVRCLRDILAARGITVSRHAVWVFLRREGLSFKKTPVRP